MKADTLTKLACVALWGLVGCGTMGQAQETKPANPPAEKTTEVAKPTPAEIAKLEEAVGLSAEQKSKVAALLTELNTRRRAVRDDASLSDPDKKTKTKAINEEIQGKQGKVRALMTADQFAKWEKLQEARRAARRN